MGRLHKKFDRFGIATAPIDKRGHRLAVAILKLNIQTLHEGPQNQNENRKLPRRLSSVAIGLRADLCRSVFLGQHDGGARHFRGSFGAFRARS